MLLFLLEGFSILAVKRTLIRIFVLETENDEHED